MSIPKLDLSWVTEARARDLSQTLGEPAWLVDERLRAVELVDRLPGEPNELFTPYHDLRPIDFGAIEPFDPAAPGEGIAGAALPEGAAAFVHVHDDALVGRVLGREATESGIVITTFGDASGPEAELLRETLEEGASLPADDAFGQVARAMSTVGLLVYVPDGVTLREPIMLRWQQTQQRRGLVSRLVVVLGKNAHASIFEEQVGGTPGAAPSERADSFWWGTTEVRLDDGATLDFAGEQYFGADTAAFVTRHARVGADGAINWAIASVGSRFHRSRIENLLEGRGSSVRQVEIGFGDKRQTFDLTSYTRHHGEDTTSDLLSKGIFSGKSRGYIKGMIEIARSAIGTDTFLGEFSMLLEKSARSVTVPSLEIDQPNVRRAMHSSSVGPIDETQVFYLMSRGLTRDQAHKAIVLGFLEPVVARIPLASAQERLRGMLEQKWPHSADTSVAA